MREHMGLFRGKRIDNGDWVEGAFCPKNSRSLWGEPENKPHIIKLDDPFSGFWFEVDPTTIGECTGLKDKNGKLIFEGDVTKDGWYREWEIVGRPGGFAARRFPEEWMLIESAAGLSDVQNALWLEDTHEIIGNIHDNKELLKGGEQ